MKKEKPTTVFDVAVYILEKLSAKQKVTSWKLQKLVYYCQAWSLVWDEKPLFSEKIIAWANGPVVNELYQAHKGQFYIEKLHKGAPDSLSVNQKDTIDHVLKAYGNRTAQWLSDLTHLEEPWINARKGLPFGSRGNVEITLASMHEYYSSIDAAHILSS